MRKSNLSIEDKKFVVEYGLCWPNIVFPQNANGQCFYKSFYYNISKARLLISRL